MQKPSFSSILTLVLGFISTVQAIDCYKCTSMNGKTKECEDEFNKGIETVHLIERECVYGNFKGTHCIKFKGEREDGTKITVRDCSDADWGSHCGDIKYQSEENEQMITGCLEACDHDGCNTATEHAPCFLLIVFVLPVMVIMTFIAQNSVWRTFIS